MNRRSFLGRAAGVTASLGLLGSSPVRAIEAFRRSGTARLQLGLAAYSFREYFKDAPRPRDSEGKRIDLFDFVDYCADHGCQGAELTSYYFPKEPTEEFLLRLKRHAFLRGVAVSGTAVGNSFTEPDPQKRRKEIDHVKRWVDNARVLGAPHIRVFAGSVKEGSKDEAKKRVVDALAESCEYAGKHGVFLGLENHGGITAECDDLLEMVRAVNSPWFGINLDSGNFHTQDPYADMARCAPYTVNVQIKEEISARGAKKERADFKRLVGILKEVKYQGYVTLEYESARDPWQAVPGLLKELAGLLN